MKDSALRPGCNQAGRELLGSFSMFDGHLAEHAMNYGNFPT